MAGVNPEPASETIAGVGAENGLKSGSLGKAGWGRKLPGNDFSVSTELLPASGP